MVSGAGGSTGISVEVSGVVIGGSTGAVSVVETGAGVVIGESTGAVSVVETGAVVWVAGSGAGAGVAGTCLTTGGLLYSLSKEAEISSGVDPRSTVKRAATSASVNCPAAS